MMAASEADDASVPADLEAIRVLAQMVGVVDGPGGKPEHLALKRAQDFQFV